MCWFHSSVCPSRNNRRTKPGCRLYRSSLLGYRFDHSGSSGFVVDFRRLRLFGRGLVLKDRRNLDRYRYRYICCLAGLPARGGCRLKRIRFPLRGRLKTETACCLRQNLRFHAGYGLLFIIYFQIF